MGDEVLENQVFISNFQIDRFKIKLLEFVKNYMKSLQKLLHLYIIVNKDIYMPQH